MKIAIQENNNEYINYLLNIGYKNMNYGLKYAASLGNTDLVEFFISKGAFCLKEATKHSAKGGHIELTRSLMNKSGSQYNAMQGAAIKGDKDMFVEFSKQTSAYGLLMDAARGGNSDIIHMCIDALDNIDDGLCGAAHGGHLHWVKHFVENTSASDYNRALFFAGRGGHIHIIRYLIDIGANNLTRGLHGAARGGHLDVVEFFISKGAGNYDGCLMYASLGNKMNVIKYAIDKGATDYDTAIEYAKLRPSVKYGDMDYIYVVEFLTAYSIN